MFRKVSGGHTLILNGPSSLTLIDGHLSVLGRKVSLGEKVIVRKGKSLPFEAEEDVSLEIVLGIDATYEELVGSTIPLSWKNTVNNILMLRKHITVLILGGQDSGKTTFSTYLINLALKAKYKTAIIDLDLGQSDVGPPTSIGLGLVTEPLADLFTVKPLGIFFVGRTSPSGISERVISGFELLKTQIPKKTVDFIIINTDG